MFIAIYQWNVRPEQEAAFQHAWAKLTTIIYRKQGSLGSRLHKCDDGRYLAYAQWPDKETFLSSDLIPLSPEEEKYRKIIRDNSERIYPDMHLSIQNDQLARTPSPE